MYFNVFLYSFYGIGAGRLAFIVLYLLFLVFSEDKYKWVTASQSISASSVQLTLSFQLHVTPILRLSITPTFLTLTSSTNLNVCISSGQITDFRTQCRSTIFWWSAIRFRAISQKYWAYAIGPFLAQFPFTLYYCPSCHLIFMSFTLSQTFPIVLSFLSPSFKHWKDLQREMLKCNCKELQRLV